MTAHILPIYRSYYVDMRLREFRPVDPERWHKSVAFASDLGDRLLRAWLTTPEGRREYRRAKDNGWQW